MNTVVAIKGTNGSGKSTVVRALIAHLGTAAKLRFNSKEAGYRCRYGAGALFVLGKYRTACGGLDSSFSYAGAADDLLLCIDTLAAKGHVACEGVIAITSYGHDRMARFADKQRRKGRRMIFAHIDTCPADDDRASLGISEAAAGGLAPLATEISWSTEPSPHLPAGQRSSIAFMISSAHRTASAIALMVAGTLFPPSNCASFRAARMLAAINSTRLRPSST